MLKVTGGSEFAGINSLLSRYRYATNKLILFVCQRVKELIYCVANNNKLKLKLKCLTRLITINIKINYLCFQVPGVSIHSMLFLTFYFQKLHEQKDPSTRGTATLHVESQSKRYNQFNWKS